MTKPELAKKLLDFYKGDERKWTKGDYALNALGEPVPSTSAAAVCFCAVGACRVLGLADVVSHDDWVDLNDSCDDFEEFKAKLEAIANGH